MSGGEENLALQRVFYLRHNVLIYCYDFLKMFLSESGIAMLSVSEKGHQLAEQESKQRATSAIKAVLSPA
jgi:phosphotransacetylase